MKEQQPSDELMEQNRSRLVHLVAECVRQSRVQAVVLYDGAVQSDELRQTREAALAKIVQESWIAKTWHAFERAVKIKRWEAAVLLLQNIPGIPEDVRTADLNRLSQNKSKVMASLSDPAEIREMLNVTKAEILLTPRSEANPPLQYRRVLTVPSQVQFAYGRRVVANMGGTQVEEQKDGTIRFSKMDLRYQGEAIRVGQIIVDDPVQFSEVYNTGGAVAALLNHADWEGAYMQTTMRQMAMDFGEVYRPNSFQALRFTQTAANESVSADKVERYLAVLENRFGLETTD